jgi:hypothetical protein
MNNRKRIIDQAMLWYVAELISAAEIAGINLGLLCLNEGQEDYVPVISDELAGKCASITAFWERKLNSVAKLHDVELLEDSAFYCYAIPFVADSMLVNLNTVYLKYLEFLKLFPQNKPLTDKTLFVLRKKITAAQFTTLYSGLENPLKSRAIWFYDLEEVCAYHVNLTQVKVIIQGVPMYVHKTSGKRLKRGQVIEFLTDNNMTDDDIDRQFSVEDDCWFEILYRHVPDSYSSFVAPRKYDIPWLDCECVAFTTDELFKTVVEILFSEPEKIISK